MFTKKPVYTATDLQTATDGPETLERLRDKTLQARRLTPNLESVYGPDFDRYCQAVKSRQRLLIFMQESVMKWTITLKSSVVT